jgi:hypothetical protein
MTEARSALSVPCFAVSPHVTDPSGAIAVWWTDPPGAVMQLRHPTRGTTEMAEWLVGPGYELLLRRFPDAPELRVILDMRQMTGRSATARALLMQCGKSVARRLSHVVLIPSIHLGPAYIKIVEAAVLLVRLSGLRIDIEQDAERVFGSVGLRAAAPDAVELAPGMIAETRPSQREHEPRLR